jgi:hypothetical protein
MDPNVLVTILFVAYTVVVCAGIGGVLLTQREHGVSADESGQVPGERPTDEPGAWRGGQS